MKKKVIIIILVIAVIAGGAYSYQYYTNIDRTVEYDILLPVKGSIQEIINEDGIIEASTIHNYYADGTKKVNEVFVEIGDTVGSGTPLITYDHNLDLEMERIDKEIKALEATYEEVTSSVDFEETNAILLQREELKRQLVDVNNTLNNVTILYESGISPKSDYDVAVLAVDQINNQIEILNNEYNLLVKSVSSNVKEQYLAQIEGLLVSKSLIEVQKENYEVYASMDGIVTEKNIFNDSWPLAGTKLLEIQHKDERLAVIDFLVDDVVQLKVGMPIVLTSDDVDLRIEDIEITKIYPKADSSISELGIEQKRVRVEIELPTKYSDLTIGQDITADVILQTKTDVVLIPKDAVYELEGKDMVTKKVGENIIEVEVELGLDNEDFYEVINGVEIPDQLVAPFGS